MVPGTGIAWLFSRRLGKRGYSAGSIRKISEGIAMVTEAVCLIGVGKILFWRPKMFKFLNQCFARLRFWKSVSDSRNLLDGATAVLLETLFQNRSRAKH